MTFVENFIKQRLKERKANEDSRSLRDDCKVALKAKIKRRNTRNLSLNKRRRRKEVFERIKNDFGTKSRQWKATTKNNNKTEATSRKTQKIVTTRTGKYV